MPWALDSPRVVQGPLRSRRRWSGDVARAQIECSLDLASPSTTQAIYVHVPFCQPRCRFCDLYCFTLDAARGSHELDAFCSALEREVAWYAARAPLKARRVSTLHFGGGTPMSLGLARLGRIVDTCRTLFGVRRETETAIEVRASDINDETVSAFASAGIGRVHVGVQTLNATGRALLDRRRDGAFVLDQLARLLRAGSIVSVDVLYGLPGQAEDDLVGDLARLSGAGVHGVALYELHKTFRNTKLFDGVWRYTPNRERNFALLAEGSRFLQSRGYARGFFNHFAKGDDQNLYSTHPIRGDECLAVGPGADGHGAGAGWRNADYGHWLEAVERCGCGVDEVSLYLQDETALLEIETALMQCRVPEGSLRRFADLVDIDADRITAGWISAGLVEPRGDGLLLTDKGAWLHGNMIESLRRYSEGTAPKAVRDPR